jgi:hypothetical protein
LLLRLCTCALSLLITIPTAQAARGTTSLSDANAIANTSYAPLSDSAGPFTIAFWFQSGNVNPGPSYIAEGHSFGGEQWAVIYGYTSQQIEFFDGNGAVRLNSGITIGDTNWHHVAYRKGASGASSWDKFLDGVKTNISPSMVFSLPPLSSFYTFNADNFVAPCLCSLGDLVFYNSALLDSEILSLAQGARPPALTEQSALYWPLEGASSPEPDASGNNHSGTILGNVVQVPDPPYGPAQPPPPPPPPGTGKGSVARGTAGASNSNVIVNSTYGPLSSSDGPFTVAFWFQSANVNPGQSYIVEGRGSGQWSVIYGYTSQEIEFYTGDPNVRLNTGITISDTNWHHIAYRKGAAGGSSWDKFLDGVKTAINPSANFTLPPVNAFYAFNADNNLAPCQCNIGDMVVYGSAIGDAEIQGLAGGARPTVSPNPLLYWPLSATASIEPDVSGNNHPGTVIGSIGAVAGPPYALPKSRVTAPNAASNSLIENVSYGPFASSNGPFTIAFWFQSGNVNPGESYVMEGYGGGQWAVIYGYTPQQIEFYDGIPAVRENTGMTIGDTNWHHVAYRKSATGSSSWDKFLDGVKTEISSSIDFTLPPVSSFYALNANNALALCYCGLADVALYNTALADTEIQSLAAGAHPSSLAESPVLYWPMTGASPEPDDSGNNHPATIAGNISTGTSPPYQGTVNVTPSTATLSASESQQYFASVAGGTSSVTWFLNPAIGTIATDGIYQAPPVVSSSTTVTITATSDAYPTGYGTASVVLTPSTQRPPPSLTAVLTAQYDSSRTNSNPNETVLNTTNVNVSQFGKLFSLPVDGYVYAQPLYVPSSLIPQLGHNTVYVATMHDTVFAFDADAGAKLWSLSLGSPAGGAGGYLGPETGIVSTPVVDVTRMVLYVVAANSDGWRIHAIDLITHAEKSGSPVLIHGNVSGTGYDNVNNVITFNSSQELQRSSLLEANNTIYVSFTSYADTNPYHGWIIGYNPDTLAQTSVFCTTPNGGEAGVWMGGGAPAADASGNIYVVTANGSWDGAANFGESFLKLSPSLAPLDFFTPADYAVLNSNDADLGSTRAMLLPSTSLLMGGGKDGILWVLNQATGQMGGLQGKAGNPPIVQNFQATTNLVATGVQTNGLWDGMAYWSSASGGPLLYIHGSNDVLKAFRLSGSTFGTTPVAESTLTHPFPGGVLAVSSNGSKPGILWATTPDGPTDDSVSTGELRAFDPLTLSELWDSNLNAARDGLGNFAKFSAPTVFNGKVYVATFSNQVVVYGLLP